MPVAIAICHTERFNLLVEVLLVKCIEEQESTPKFTILLTFSIITNFIKNYYINFYICLSLVTRVPIRNIFQKQQFCVYRAKKLSRYRQCCLVDLILILSIKYFFFGIVLDLKFTHINLTILTTSRGQFRRKL